MLGEERRQQILQALSHRGAVSVATLSPALGCSEATLRRDLRRMAQAGLLRRTHGGAVVEACSEETEPSLRDKARLRAHEKRVIGHTAARLVAPGEVVALNGGTTTIQVARALRTMSELRVVTNSIGVATALSGRPEIEVTLTGGTLRGTLELSGPLAEQSLKGLYVHTAFIGVDGLSLQHGLTTYDQVEAHTNRAIMSRAQRVVVVADHTKVGKVTMALIAPCAAMSTLVTDARADAGQLEELRAAGVTIIIAPLDDGPAEALD